MVALSTDPLVSIIIPTRNRADFLKRSVGSVLSQTCRDFEIIIVDDCSIDHTKQTVDAFLDNRIRYIRHEVNKGAGATRNSGIREAKGKYVAFLDDDDEWVPEKLERQLAVFQGSGEMNVGLVYSGFIYTSSDSEVHREIKPQFRGKVFKNILQTCILGSATPLIKKDILVKAGLFDESLLSCEDWDLWIRISRLCNFDFVPDPLAKAYVHGDQLSVNLMRNMSARKNMLKKYAEEFAQYPDIWGLHLERLGVLLILADQRSEGISYFRREIQICPKSWKAYLHFCLAYAVPALHKALITQFGRFNFNGKKLIY